MKIYTRIVMDMTTMQVEEAESFEYQGELAKCGSGGGGGDTVDKDYNRRMANIAEAQQGMAEDMFNMYQYGSTTGQQTQYNLDGQWVDKQTAIDALSGATDLSNLQTRSKTVGGSQREGSTFGGREVTQYNVGGDWLSKDEAQNRLASSRSLQDLETRTTGGELGGYGTQLGLEQAQIEANMGLVPYQTSLAKSQIGSQQELLPYQTSLSKAQMQNEKKHMQAQSDATMNSEVWRGDVDIQESYLQGSADYLNETGYTKGDVGWGQWTPEKVQDLLDREGQTIREHWKNAEKNSPEEAQKLADYVHRAAGWDENQYTAQAKTLRDQLGYQRDEIAAQQKILPKQTDLTLDQIATQRQGLGLQSDYLSAMSDKNLPQQAVGAQSDFLSAARDGVDVQGRMGQAQADVTAGYQGVGDQQRLAQSRMGLNPDSGAAQAGQRQLSVQQARDIAGARTRARAQAREEDFRRKQAAANFGLQGLSYGR